jgi:hypothetical protein
MNHSGAFDEIEEIDQIYRIVHLLMLMMMMDENQLSQQEGDFDCSAEESLTSRMMKRRRQGLKDSGLPLLAVVTIRRN